LKCWSLNKPDESEIHMTKDQTRGSCFCGKVSYEINGNFGVFQYCHCSRCRKFTGSALAANILVSPDHFKWLKGESLVGKFSPEDTKHFSTAFCTNCGSSLPWFAKTGKTVVIPAGTLDEHPNIEPSQNIFYASKAIWYKPPDELIKYDELPVRADS